MCYGMRCPLERWDGECGKPAHTRCPADYEEEWELEESAADIEASASAHWDDNLVAEIERGLFS